MWDDFSGAIWQILPLIVKKEFVFCAIFRSPKLKITMKKCMLLEDFQHE